MQIFAVYWYILALRRKFKRETEERILRARAAEIESPDFRKLLGVYLTTLLDVEIEQFATRERLDG